MSKPKNDYVINFKKVILKGVIGILAVANVALLCNARKSENNKNKEEVYSSIISNNVIDASEFTVLTKDPNVPDHVVDCDETIDPNRPTYVVESDIDVTKFYGFDNYKSQDEDEKEEEIDEIETNHLEKDIFTIPDNILMKDGTSNFYIRNFELNSSNRYFFQTYTNNHRPFNAEQTITERLTYLAQDILHFDSPYITYNTIYDGVREIAEANITNQYKIEYISKLFDLSNRDLFLMYQYINEKIIENPQINYDEIVNDILPVVFNREKLNIISAQYFNNNNAYTPIDYIANAFVGSYISNELQDQVLDYMVECLFMRLVYNTPEEFMNEYIPIKHNLTSEEEKLVCTIQTKESNKNNYTCGYVVGNIFGNRAYRVPRWFINDGRDERNIFKQMARPGQSSVYSHPEWYLDIINEDPHQFEAWFGVRNYLYYGININPNEYFVSKDYDPNGSIQYVDNGNHFYSDITDEVIPFEEQIDYFAEKYGITNNLEEGISLVLD